MAFSGLGAVMVSIGKMGVGQPANQVKAGRLRCGWFTALWDLAYGILHCLVRWFGFQAIRFLPVLPRFGVGVSPHGRGVLRIV